MDASDKAPLIIRPRAEMVAIIEAGGSVSLPKIGDRPAYIASSVAALPTEAELAAATGEPATMEDAKAKLQASIKAQQADLAKLEAAEKKAKATEDKAK